VNTVDQNLRNGWALHQHKRFADAETLYRKALSQDAANSNAWCYLGMVLHDQRHYDQAVTTYRKALELQPEFPIALNNLGNSLRYTGDIEEADKCFQAAINLKPDYLNAYKNRGTLHVWTGSLDLGLSYYQRALQINPNDAELHRNLGVIYLLQGNFEEGWSEYRWRWKTGDLHRPSAEIPVWHGGSVAGRRLLLTAEQGLGDTLNFVRFAGVLQEQGGCTTVYCQSRLLALLQASATQVGAVYPNNLPLDPRAHDLQCSLLDVADVLHVNANTIPNQVPYLKAAENLVAYWKPRTPGTIDEFRIGICWQGNPDHQADMFRSIPLAEFETLADVSNIRLVSLQKGHGSEQMASWRGKQALEVLPSNIDTSSGAFMDTAAILMNLDLVITSDTSIAHLAAALGRPCWIALGYVPDWRWLLHREDSPWYPNVRLFRQPKLGDWNSVFSSIREALNAVVNGGCREWHRD
jgi:Tfp pilus assembly protein PilF